MDNEARRTRRDFLVAAGHGGRRAAADRVRGIPARPEEKKLEEGEAGVTPTEGLMRQHGVLERVLLIYEEGVRRIETDEVLLPENLADAATVVRAFIEDFHQKQEESEVFLRLEKAGKLAPLTAVLRAQHKAGHDATDEILKRLEPRPFNEPEMRRELAGLMRGFARMVPATLRARGHGGVPRVPPGDAARGIRQRSATWSRNASGRRSGRKASTRSWRGWRRSKRRWRSPTWRSSRRRTWAGVTANSEYSVLNTEC